MQKEYGIDVHDLQYIVDAAQDDLDRLRCSHIFLTGCTGFLGKWMVETLVYANEILNLQMRITVLTRSVKRVFKEMPHWQGYANMCLAEGDVISWDPKQTPCVSHIIHGANYTNAGQEDWALEHMTTAYEGTRCMLEMAREHQSQALLLLSSGAVYGLAKPTNEAPFVEQECSADDYVREPHVYALCKYFEETYTAAFGKKYGIRIPVARLFSFMGKYMPLHQRQALSSFINDVQNGRDITIQGDGTAVRSYMYAADMVVWLLALLVRGEHGTPYNVGSNQSVSMIELANAVVQFSQKKLSIHILNKPISGNAPNVYTPCIDRCGKMFQLKNKFKLTVSLNKILRGMI